VTAAATLVAFAMALPAGDGSGRAARERLAFNIAADGSVVEALRAHLGPELAARSVDLDMTPVATIDIERVLATAAERTPGGPLARAWLDGRDPRVAVLFLIPRETDRVLVRKVPVGAGFDAVALAEIAYIVERAVASLLAAEPIGVPPAEVRATLAQESISPTKMSSSTAATTVAAPAPTAPARFAFDGSAFAGVSAWAPGASAVLSVGLSFGAERVGPATRVGLMLAAAGRQSFDVASSPAGVHVSGGDVHLYLTSARTLGRWGLGRLGIGPGLVVARVEPVGAGPSATQVIEAQPRTDVDPTIAAVARWDAPVGRLARPFIAATVDFVPVRGAYTAIVNGTSRTLLAPWPVRPGLVAGIAFGP
jgi:hypothetical protein